MSVKGTRDVRPVGPAGTDCVQLKRQASGQQDTCNCMSFITNVRALHTLLWLSCCDEFFIHCAVCSIIISLRFVSMFTVTLADKKKSVSVVFK